MATVLFATETRNDSGALSRYIGSSARLDGEDYLTILGEVDVILTELKNQRQDLFVELCLAFSSGNFTDSLQLLENIKTFFSKGDPNSPFMSVAKSNYQLIGYLKRFFEVAQNYPGDVGFTMLDAKDRVNGVITTNEALWLVIGS